MDTKRLFRLNRGLCLYCGKMGHFLAACPIRPTVSAIHAIQENMPLLTTVVMFIAPYLSVPVVALLDSGSVRNFIPGVLSPTPLLDLSP